jgi:lipopolysaccharide export system permease protein
MNKLDWYIGRTVFVSILAVLGVILGLALLFAFIDQLGDFDDNYGVAEALKFVLLTSPRRAYEMLPMAALIGCLIGLGTLASSSELIVMRAAGVSLGRIVWAVMKPMFVLLIAGILVGEYVAPWSENLAQSGRALAQSAGKAQSSRHGLWHRQGHEYTHVNAVQPNGLLLGVTRYEFDDNRHLLQSSFAQRGIYRGDYWELENVSITDFGNCQTSVRQEPKVIWSVELTPQVLDTVIMEPDALSISGLWWYIHYLADQGLSNKSYWLAFWSKIFQPLVTAALVLMAISFIFGPLRSVTLGQRIFTGVIIGFALRIFQDLLGPSSLVFGFSPLLAVLAPALLCAVAGVLLLRRAG